METNRHLIVAFEQNGTDMIVKVQEPPEDEKKFTALEKVAIIELFKRDLLDDLKGLKP